MGRKTKAQRDRAARRRTEIKVDETTSIQLPAKKPKSLPEAFKAFGEAVQKQQRDARQPGQAPREGMRARPSDAQREEAGRRLKALTEMLQSQPKPILDQLTEIGVPWTRVHNVRGNPAYDTVVMKVADLEAADQQIASRGTLYDQMYHGKEQNK